jgi:hypothetical protein
MCLCGWLAPLCSPELKKANNLGLLELVSTPVPASHSLKQEYVAPKSCSSRRLVCGLKSIVVRIKWCGITGNLFMTILCEGVPRGIWATSRSLEGLRKGLGLLVGCAIDEDPRGFFESAGQYRSWKGTPLV